MSKRTLVAVAALLALAASARADGRVYEVSNWPQDIDLIPCSAWTKASDGGWALNGSIRVGDGESIDNVGIKDDAPARYVDQHCGVSATKAKDAGAKAADTKTPKKKRKKDAQPTPADQLQ
jgi:hypothetical protein